MALAFPPVCDNFLRMFGVGPAAVVWDNPSAGTFGLVVPAAGGAPAPPVATAFTLPESPCGAAAAAAPPAAPCVVEVESELAVPVIPAERQSSDPPLCAHGRPTLRRTVSKADSPNRGRLFYVCPFDAGRRCPFFRWADDLATYSVVSMRPTLTVAEVTRETADIDPGVQLSAWLGVSQGTEEWHRLRACRITASNFGSVNRTNTFSGPTDLLRSILWPQNFDSVPMRYGSLNESVALARFSEYLTAHGEAPDLPIYIDTPGIWISKAYPFLGGSPDGVVYETLESYPMGEPGGATFYRCRRSLLEI